MAEQLSLPLSTVILLGLELVDSKFCVHPARSNADAATGSIYFVNLVFMALERKFKIESILACHRVCKRLYT